MYSLIFKSCILFSIFLYSFGEICKSPVVQPVTYTTTDGMVVSEVVMITEFTVKCENGIKDLSLYADVKGKTFPAVKSADGSGYQVSWIEDSTKVASGSQDVKIYDEEGFAALRKAQRNGEKTSDIPSTFSISIYHLGTYFGPWVQSEFLATTFSVLLWYLAFSTRSRLIN